MTGSSSSNRSTLIISRSAPYSSTLAQSALDYALAAAAFEQPVNLLFLGEGVLQLIKGQETAGPGQKNLGKRLSSLPLYGVEKVYVDEDALVDHDLGPDQLVLPVEPIKSEDIQSLMASHDQVASF